MPYPQPPFPNPIVVPATGWATDPWLMFFSQWARQFAAAFASAIHSAVVTGGAAGDFTVTGIAPSDQLVSVQQYIGAGVAVTALADLTSEFTITAADTINNTGGTDTTGDQLLVSWVDLT